MSIIGFYNIRIAFRVPLAVLQDWRLWPRIGRECRQCGIALFHSIKELIYFSNPFALSFELFQHQRFYSNLFEIQHPLNNELNIPKSFKDAGIDETEFLAKVDLLADRAFEDQCTTANPRLPLVSELKKILISSINIDYFNKISYNYSCVNEKQHFLNLVTCLFANKLYNELNDLGIDTLLDDRDERPGVKFNDMDLIGIPFRITIGKKVTENMVEIKERTSKEFTEISIDDVVEYTKNFVANSKKQLEI